MREIRLIPENGGMYHTYQKRKLLYFDRIRPAALARSAVDKGLYDAWGFEWFVQFPLVSEGSVVGIFALSGPPRKRLSRAELDFCTRLGAQVAGAIRTSELLAKQLQLAPNQKVFC